MPEAVAPAAVAPEPTKIPPPVAAGPQGAGALAEGEKANGSPPAEDPFEFDLDVKGQRQKLKFQSKDQLKAVLQKALYADQVIKDASQAKKGAADLIQKLKEIGQGNTRLFHEIMSDPEIGGDAKRLALSIVREMMDDEKLTPEQREAREWRTKAEKLEAEKKEREEAEARRIAEEKNTKLAQETSRQIIDAMKKYPDVPQTPETMDACILAMRSAYRRFGKHLTPDQAMTVVSDRYWRGLLGNIDKMTPEQLSSRFGSKTLDKIQKLKLAQLKDKTNPAKQVSAGAETVKKKKHLTEKEFEKHFQELAGGL